MGIQTWFLYALRCTDDTLYAGVTTDLARRLAQHNAGRGARYTSGRRPVTLVAAWSFPGRGAAQRAEARFRQLSRARKLTLIGRGLPFAGGAFYDEERSTTAALSSVRFCPRCGGLLKRVTRPEDDRSRQVCTACRQIHYRNAKPCAGALVVRDGRLLLVKRAVRPFLGSWDIPRGFLEEDEHPKAGAVREVQEETGLHVQVTTLFGFYLERGREGDYCLNIYFLAEDVQGREHPGDEATELGWFAPDQLPQELAFDHVRGVLDDWSEWMDEQDGA